jgi:type II secretory pathway pseudopilin PulG
VKKEQPVEPCREPGKRLLSRRAFSLVEVLLVVSLLSLIVLVLMTVFNSTQSAFRAGMTQTDVLGSGRAAMGLIVSDLKLMTPSDGAYTNALNPQGTVPGSLPPNSAPTFFVNTNVEAGYQPLYQSLPGSIAGVVRTNVLENFFVLSRQNVNGHDTWLGTGYTVNATNTWPLFPLYRFTTNCPASSDPTALFNAFLYAIQNVNEFYTNAGWSHLIDGVVDLRAHPFDMNGYQMTNNYYNFVQQLPYTNVLALTAAWSDTGFYFFSNALPASVEVQMATLEDHVLQRAGSLPLESPAQTNYLAQQAGRVHVFRQRVLIPNVDPTTYP